ncbi:hypothetical protein ACQ9ZF_09885 (plasmid) [Cetobacterium somerae]|jgi:hypothetical protein|uniref:hypothetical protein n=1 Tax=Cetobacterium somerae TaxID=188913 RepID=UPI003D767327
MIFGEKIKIKFENIEDGTKLTIYNFPKSISVTALDFGKDLAKRTMEGYSPNPLEEIDVISGIENESTTGEDIIFLYKHGDAASSMILAGVLCKKLLSQAPKAIPLEIGGIYHGEKNEAYIRVAIQKMIITHDSLGSSLEINLPIDTNMNNFKSIFSNIAFSLIPETQAIQFGSGCSVTKKAHSNLTSMPKRVEISLAPNIETKIPALALVYDIIFESIAAFSLLNS